MKTALKLPSEQLRVIIADDHPVVRHGLRAILQSQKDIHIIAQAADGEEACRLCDQLSPDALLLDLRMPKKDGFQVVTELRARSGKLKPGIIVMTTYEGEEDIRRALSAGAKGYLAKGTAPEQIREAAFVGWPKANPGCRPASPRNWPNQWRIRNSPTASAKSCGRSPEAAAIKRSAKCSISAKIPSNTT